ncbi:MAG TPA: pantoate--beta-alanine ligase [Bacteroidia bacterium]|nr:pantoate--beta-alanine ligase [Bacteroidia bacterium]
MEVFKEKLALIAYLKNKPNIGFVPTMGALHKGHVSLIHLSVNQCDTTVCSIFVNPTQFNDKKDLINYPRTEAQDLELLKEAGCDVVFMPEVDEIYPKGYTLQTYNFGNIEKVMEGEHRPGHFNGMANVVQRFFEIVKPNFAFFGEKDFQQLCVVKQLIEMLQLKITIVPGKIIRENDGLAMSSRNMLLNEEERKQAVGIYQTLTLVKSKKSTHSLSQLIELAYKNFENYPLITPEYIQFAYSDNLQSVNSVDISRPIMMFMAVKLGKVRLIDNMPIYE